MFQIYSNMFLVDEIEDTLDDEVSKPSLEQNIRKSIRKSFSRLDTTSDDSAKPKFQYESFRDIKRRRYKRTEFPSDVSRY